MTWKGVGSFLAINLKDYVNLLLGGCFTFKHVLAKFCPLLCWIMLKCVHGKLEVLRLTQASF